MTSSETSTGPAPATHDVDVLIVGAGVSGIDAACQLARDLPGTSFAILERRHEIGGTWDLFRYPGVRSDSDMLTFGYRFRPWQGDKVLADGASIRQYVRDTAREFGVEQAVRYGRRVVRAEWSSADQRWTVEVRREPGAATGTDADGATEQWTCQFLLACTGYYDYDAGHRPSFPGEENFRGHVVHPQFWPADLDYAGKHVVVIGSGATAVTLVPAMATDAAHVTMLQRSPSWILSLPAVDAQAVAARRMLPDNVVYRIFRTRNILAQRATFAIARRRPTLAKRVLLRAAAHQVGEANLPHFTPRYDPWTQRLCMVPDGDLFQAVRSGRASVVTDTIESFTETGIRTTSGTELPADVIVTATGLKVQMLGGAELIVDGVAVTLGDLLTYKGVLVEDVPNLAVIFGYTNASWTLKADIACAWVVRLLRTMRQRRATSVIARARNVDRDTVSVLGSLEAGYVRRGDALLPRQGRQAPWRVFNDYLRDWLMLKVAPVDDGNLEFTSADVRVRQPA